MDEDNEIMTAQKIRKVAFANIPRNQMKQAKSKKWMIKNTVLSYMYMYTWAYDTHS